MRQEIISALAQWIPGGLQGQYNSAVLDDNLEHSGGVTVSWNSGVYAEIPFGTSITIAGTKYSLLEPYAPDRGSIGIYRYAPRFMHPVARLGRVPCGLYDADGNELPTGYITNYPQVIADYLARYFTLYAMGDSEFAATFGIQFDEVVEGGVTRKVYRSGAWGADFGGANLSDKAMITVDLDGCSIRTAAERIADAMKCNAFFDWANKKIKFVAGTTIDGEYYNCFKVMGGTTNMARRVGGGYVAVTERLMLDTDAEAGILDGSIMDFSGEGDIRLTTNLVLDNIYPKTELMVSSVRERLCYLTDENGERIVDHYEDGSGNAVASTATGAVPIYKTFAKWYVALKVADTDADIFRLNEGNIIQGRTLGVTFLSGSLTGRTFELVHFNDSDGTIEYDSDTDVAGTATPVPKDWFRIIFVAEGSEIIPSTAARLIVPAVGNRVSLVNVVPSAEQKAAAKAELKESALEIIALRMNRIPQMPETFVGNVPYIGQAKGDGLRIAVGISHNLDTGVAEVTWGNWASRRTLTGGTKAKIESISTGGSGTKAVSTGGSVDGATIGGSGLAGKYGNNTGYGHTTGYNTVSQHSYETLNQTIKKPDVAEQVSALGADIAQIKEQTDHEFLIWYGSGAPTAQNSPASEWVTNELKDLHVQDIYYDISRAAGSTGGRAWRWMKLAASDANGTLVLSSGKAVEYDSSVHAYFTYGWVEITDQDTNAALEKIADVASDGIISGGAEKSRVYIEWQEAVQNYLKYSSLMGADGYDMSGSGSAFATFASKLQAVGSMLNTVRGALQAFDPATQINSTLAWFTTTNLQQDVDLSLLTYNNVAIGAAGYRTRWSEYYAALADLINAVNVKIRSDNAATKATADAATVTKVSNTLPTPPYKVGDLWQKDGELLSCVTAKTSGQTASPSDWISSDKIPTSSVNDLMAQLAEDWESLVAGQDLTVTIGDEPSDPSTGDLWYDPSNAQLRRNDGHWAEPEVGTESIAAIARKLGTVSFHFRRTIANQALKWDVCALRATYSDKLTGTTVSGSLGVWVNDGSSWIRVRDNESTVLEQFSNKIIAAIFGDDVYDNGELKTPGDYFSNQSITSYASGLTIAKNFAEMFAQASDPSTGEMKAKAGIVVRVANNQGYVDITGTFTSADGYVRIQEYEEMLDSVRKNTALMLGDPSGFLPVDGETEQAAFDRQYAALGDQEVLIRRYNQTYYGGSSGRGGQIIIKGFVNNEETDETIINDSGVYSGEFGIRAKQSGHFVTCHGVGSISSPAQFTDANGNTVTVIGGIITSITQPSVP